ncbi:MAG: hypothetical protein PHV17_06860, partial [Candidatus Omnitrophica bacterium]|nr:hypothetical protein [Candidatus Omnitrophota bacterium]
LLKIKNPPPFLAKVLLSRFYFSLSGPANWFYSPGFIPLTRDSPDCKNTLLLIHISVKKINVLNKTDLDR